MFAPFWIYYPHYGMVPHGSHLGWTPTQGSAFLPFSPTSLSGVWSAFRPLRKPQAPICSLSFLIVSLFPGRFVLSWQSIDFTTLGYPLSVSTCLCLPLDISLRPWFPDDLLPLVWTQRFPQIQVVIFGFAFSLSPRTVFFACADYSLGMNTST